MLLVRFFKTDTCYKWRPLLAKLFSDAHEIGQSGLATYMDFYNNAVGIDIGLTALFMSESGKANAVLQAVNNGRLKYICNGQLIFTNQTC